ncbi:hypothetical protein Bca4012_008570 [Brassica carinata]
MEKSTKITRPAKCSMKGLREEKKKRRKMVMTGSKRSEYPGGGGYYVRMKIKYVKHHPPKQNTKTTFVVNKTACLWSIRPGYELSRKMFK